MKNHNIYILSFLLLSSSLYGSIKEHFIVGWNRGVFHILEKKELLPYSLVEYERFYPYNWYYLQVYFSRRSGVQIEYGRQKHEKWRENFLKEKYFLTSGDRREYFFLNLLFKFQTISRLNVSPYTLLGAGIASVEEEFSLKTAMKVGGGLKYHVLHSIKKGRDKGFLFLNINFGVFLYTPSIKGHSNHWDLQYGLELGF